MAAAKKGISESTERKATAEGDLGVTSKELAEDKAAKAEASQQCEAAAATYAAESKSRDEELAALAKAKEVIIEATGGSAAACIQDDGHDAVQRCFRQGEGAHFQHDCPVGAGG